MKLIQSQHDALIEAETGVRRRRRLAPFTPADLELLEPFFAWLRLAGKA